MRLRPQQPPLPDAAPLPRASTWRAPPASSVPAPVGAPRRGRCLPVSHGARRSFVIGRAHRRARHRNPNTQRRDHTCRWACLTPRRGGRSSSGLSVWQRRSSPSTAPRPALRESGPTCSTSPALQTRRCSTWPARHCGRCLRSAPSGSPRSSKPFCTPRWAPGCRAFEFFADPRNLQNTSVLGAMLTGESRRVIADDAAAHRRVWRSSLPGARRRPVSSGNTRSGSWTRQHGQRGVLMGGWAWKLNSLALACWRFGTSNAGGWSQVWFLCW